MARSKASSTDTQSFVPLGEHVKTRRKKTSTVDKKREPLETTEFGSSSTSILSVDANKENETLHCISSSKTSSASETILQALNTAAGNPLPPSIQIKSLVLCSECLHSTSTITRDFSHLSHVKEKKIEIINIARHCLQKVSLKGLESSLDFQMANLCVGIYCLRSVNNTLLSAVASKDTKALAALDRSVQLYFLYISVSQHLAVECDKSNRDHNDDNFTSIRNIYMAVHLCLGAYEGLGNLLQHIWNLPWMTFSHDASPILSIFPIPDIPFIERDKDNLEKCTQPLISIDFKNIFRSIISLCTALTTLSQAPLLNSYSLGNIYELINIVSQKFHHFHTDYFGKNFLMKLFDTQQTSTQPFQIILSHVLMPWMMTALSFENITVEALVEISHRGYTMLWGAARDVDRSHRRDCFRQYKLKLQEDALLLLLFFQKESEYNSDKLKVLRLKSLDQVCKLASDVSSAYYKSGQCQPDNDLIRFHRNVGDAIDSVAIHQNNIQCIYIEYCARRGVHLARSYSSMNRMSKKCDCMFSEFPFPFSHEKHLCFRRETYNFFTKWLALVFITICLKENLFDSKIVGFAEIFICDYLSIVDSIGGLSAAHTTDLPYAFRLLKILDIHSGPSERFNDLETYRLQALASVCSRVYIPTLNTLSRNINNLAQVDRNETAFIGIHLLLKTVHMLDKLKDFIQSDKCISMTVDLLLDDGYTFSTDLRIKLSETAAKTFSIVGATRKSQKGDRGCVIPIVANIELLDLCFSVSRKLEYRISERYAHLSKLCQSYGMIQEATTATVLSLRSLISELNLTVDPKTCGIKESDFLLSMDENSVQQSSIGFPRYWPETLANKCRSLLCKLVLLLRNHLSTSIDTKAFFAENYTVSTWPFMKELYAIYDDSNSLQVTKIIRRILLACAGDAESNASRLSLDVIKISIWELIRNFDYDPVFVQDILDVAISFSCDHGDQLSCIELNAITAVALTSVEKGQSQARRCLDEALKWCEGTQELGVIFMVYKSALNFFRLHVLTDVQDQNPQDLALLTFPLRSKGYEEFVHICNDCLRTLVQVDPSSNVMLINRVIALLTKAVLMLDYVGCSASYALMSLPRFPSSWEYRLNLSILRYAYAFNLLGGENYHELGGLLYEIKVEENYSNLICKMPRDSKRLFSLMRHGDIDENIAQLCSDILMHTINLETCVYLTSIAELSGYVHDIDSLAIQLSEFDEGKLTHNSFKFLLQVIHELWIISCYNFLHGFYDKMGHVVKALHYLRQSCYRYQRVLKYLERWQRRDDLPGRTWKNLHQFYYSRTFTFHLSSRISNCYIRLSSLYTRLGDSHKSIDYSLLSVETLSTLSSFTKINRRMLIIDLFKGLSCNSRRTYRLSRSLRSYIESYLLSLPFDSMNTAVFDLFRTRLGVIMDEVFVKNQANIDKDWQRETIKDLLLLGDAFTRNRGILANKDIFHYRALSLSLTSSQSLPNIEMSIDTLMMQLREYSQLPLSLDPTLSDVIARVGECLHKLDDEESAESCLQILQKAASSTVASSLSKGLSLYQLGSYFLDLARDAGELNRLWEGYSNQRWASHISSSQGNIALARNYFRQASYFAGPASSLLSRKIIRCLALTTGPKLSHMFGYSACEFIHSSIGSNARMQASKIYESHPVLSDLFTAFDVPLNEEARRHDAFKELYTIGSKFLPLTWNFISMSLCPSGEVLISAIHRSLSEKSSRPFTTDIICIFPTSESEERFSVVDDLLIPFNKLMERSHGQLSRSMDETNIMSNNDSSAKETWWMERRALDIELERLLAVMDKKLFRHTCLKEVVSPYSLYDVSSEEDDLRPVSGNLSLKFEAMCNISKSHVSRRIPEESISNATTISRTQIRSSSSTDQVVFLVLDEHFQSLPVENLPTFIESTVCRIPSLPFAIARCRNQSYEQFHNLTVDLSKTTYVLDPESNLAETRGRMHKFFEQLSSDSAWDWNGFTGEIPEDDIMKAALTKDHSLYLFCGHGGGECILPRPKFERIFLDGARDENFLQCQSAMVLMGCSSGRLVSINSPKDEFAPIGEFHYEPDGAIISYLCAGTPCVVANLWDVTDRDIDRYFMELLTIFVAGDSGESDGMPSMSLAECVAKARSACKLRYIIGCAPIIYGVPVYKL